MPVPANPQRVPLTSGQGGPGYITKEWLRIFQELTGQVTPTTGTITPEALADLIGALTTRVTALEARMADQEEGYHI